MDLGLTEKVFLVTPATCGLGLATAGALLAEGARVVISCPARHAVDRVTVQLGEPDRTAGVAASNADPDAADRLVTAALTRFGRLDGILACADGFPAGALTAFTDQQWRSWFESAFLGALRLVRTATPVMAAAGSVALAAAVPRTPQPGMIISGDLQAGLAMLAKMLASELGPAGVRVNCLLAEQMIMEGPASAAAGTGHPEHQRYHFRRAGEVPLQPHGTPDGFARVAAFVLSSAASSITGAVITSGGEGMHAG